MTTKKNATGNVAQAELCPNAQREQAQRNAIDQMFALHSIAQGLSAGLNAYQELLRIEHTFQMATECYSIKPPECLKPRSECTEQYHLEDLANAFAHLVQQQGDALHIIGGGDA